MSLRVTFLGASAFGLRCLAAVATMPECEVVGIISVPRKFRISYSAESVTNVLHADFEAYARSRGIPFVMMDGKMTDPAIVAAIRDWRPDLLIAVGWYHLVPREVREIAPAVGMHASLLPDYSGGAPLVWAIINGEKRTGITLFELSDGVDDGPVLAQAIEPILDDDTIATLYARIEERGLELLREQLPRLARGEAASMLQDASRRRVFPQRSPEDGRIDWTWSARRVYDFVRAQTRPYPGAFTAFRGDRLKIWQVAATEQAAAGLPGELFREDEGTLSVRCGDACGVLLLEVEWAGDTMSGGDFGRNIGCEKGRAIEERLG